MVAKKSKKSKKSKKPGLTGDPGFMKTGPPFMKPDGKSKKKPGVGTKKASKKSSK